MKTLAIFATCWLATTCPAAIAQTQDKHPFTVRDDIALVRPGGVSEGKSPVIVSPDRRYVIVHTEYGSAETNRLYDRIAVYRMADMDRAATRGTKEGLHPLWSLDEISARTGDNRDVVKKIAWTPDSGGFTFVARTDHATDRLYLATIATRSLTALTPETLDVTGYSIKDAGTYVFTAKEPAPQPPIDSPGQTLRTGYSIYHFLNREGGMSGERSALWSVRRGVMTPVMDPASGHRRIVFDDGITNLALSPDGSSVLTLSPVPTVPSEWEKLYPPPYPEAPYRMQAGKQDLDAASGIYILSQFVAIDLATGATRLLAQSPYATRVQWWSSFATTAWSPDGKSAILPNVFPPVSQMGEGPARPCLAVVDIASSRFDCVQYLRRQLSNGYEPGYERINTARFTNAAANEMMVTVLPRIPDRQPEALNRFYRRDASGAWIQTRSEPAPKVIEGQTGPHIEMSYQKAPRLVIEHGANASKRLEIPLNDDLDRYAFGAVSVYKWHDDRGAEHAGLLYRPFGYREGVRYPFVIQTHGYDDEGYEPSGNFPTAFAAQELASAGIMVIQMADCNGRMSPDEIPCNVRAYDALVAALDKAGMIDPAKVGLTGFSRTVSYTMGALTSGKTSFAAATVADGVDLGYLQHLFSNEFAIYRDEDYAMIGGPPFGEGLAKWAAHSPEFNMDKVHTPLRILTEEPLTSVLFQWEPYALLRELKRPVDLIQIKTHEHILTEPVARMAGQGGTVDWYRFWLQGYEDPDPAKAAQYRRWEGMCGTQKATSDRPVFCTSGS